MVKIEAVNLNITDGDTSDVFPAIEDEFYLRAYSDLLVRVETLKTATIVIILAMSAVTGVTISSTVADIITNQESNNILAKAAITVMFSICNICAIWLFTKILEQRDRLQREINRFSGR